MAFLRQSNITILGFEDVNMNLFIPGASNVVDPQSGKIDVQLALSNGGIYVAKFDLLARLGDDAPGLVHRSNLLDLKDYILTRITNEVLPL